MTWAETSVGQITAMAMAAMEAERLIEVTHPARRFALLPLMTFKGIPRSSSQQPGVPKKNDWIERKKLT